MPLNPNAPTLTLAESYSASQTFLVHIGAPPTVVAEPVDGIVEMVGGGYFSRLRYNDIPITQGAILALLKLTEDTDDAPVLFSASGFTGAAEVFGENLNVALFEVTPIGDIVPHSKAAHALMPTEPFEPPFPGNSVDEASDRPKGPWLPGVNSEIADHEWLDCPSCGTTHHPTANFCHKCGADLTRKSRVVPTARADESATPSQALPIEPRRRAKASSYRCRVCGSDDVEFVAD